MLINSHWKGFLLLLEAANIITSLFYFLQPASELRRQSAKRRSIRVLNNKRALVERNQVGSNQPNLMNESKVVTGSMLVPPNHNASLVTYNEFAVSDAHISLIYHFFCKGFSWIE